MLLRAWSAALCACFVLGCSPTVRVAVRFDVPGGVPIDVARFHVTGRATCPPGAGPAIGATRLEVRHVVPSHFDVRASFRGKRCLVQLTGWLDVDGSKTRNRGDLLATSPGVLVEDRGLIGGNLVSGPTLTLAAVP